MLGNRVGPTIRQSLSENPHVVLALVSNTTLNFVVVHFPSRCRAWASSWWILQVVRAVWLAQTQI